MQFVFKIFFIITFLTPSLFTFSQEQAINKMDEISQRAEVQWELNPFRKTDKERLLFGWQDPNAFITRFWIGDIPTAQAMFPNPHWNLDSVLVYFSPTLATELSPIAFQVDRLKVHMGAGFLLEANLLAYNGHKLKYGSVPFYSDYMQVSFYIDFIIDDEWKLRWQPIVHVCSHAGGDFLGDDGFGHGDEFADMGNENMTFALYRNWKWFTFYGGFGFRMITNSLDAYGTLFQMNFGVDMRIPIWGKINFITGLYTAANYDEIKIFSYENNKLNLISQQNSWYPTVSLGIGIEIDRLTLGFKYLYQRSRQVLSYQVIEQRLGFETTLYF